MSPRVTYLNNTLDKDIYIVASYAHSPGDENVDALLRPWKGGEKILVKPEQTVLVCDFAAPSTIALYIKNESGDFERVIENLGGIEPFVRGDWNRNGKEIFKKSFFNFERDYCFYTREFDPELGHEERYKEANMNFAEYADFYNRHPRSSYDPAELEKFTIFLNYRPLTKAFPRLQ